MDVQEHHPNSRPFDFSFRYDFSAGNVPPEKYYEYVIDVAPDGSGEIRYLPDYPANHPEELVEIFQLSEEEMDRIFHMMIGLGLLHPVWMPEDRRKPGGPRRTLQVVAGGRWYQFDEPVSEGDAEGLEKLIDLIRGGVPQAVWDKIGQMKAT